MSSLIGLQELLKASLNDSVVAVKESAPYTTIQNRAKVTRSLKAVAGVERITIRSVNRLADEYGPNGEYVYEADNKDARIRFVGTWLNIQDTQGTYTYTNTLNDFVEVTFYGTGLNILTHLNANARDLRATTDGGAEGANFLSTYATVLTGRSYEPNQSITVVSGLSLGWHTVKIRYANASNTFYMYGVSILNERNDIAVYPGTAIADGTISGLTSLTTTSFTEGVTGTKGARVVKYLEGNSIKSAVQEVDTTAKYLTNTDHTNEEVLRRINFMEFGVGRSDDFVPTLNGTARAFTLNDGTTTLTGTAPSTFSNLLDVGGNGASITLTFVGTGLDVIRKDNASGGADNYQIYVDGTLQGTWTSGSTNQRSEKICSGLPYGTHTVKILRVTAVTFSVGIADFIIYQPKKPSIPDGTKEIADFCVLATHSALSTYGLDAISQGVIRKQIAGRESIFSNGTGGTVDWNVSLDVGNNVSGLQTYTNRQGGYFQHSGFCTGFEYRYRSRSDAATAITITLNGLTLNTTNFPSLTATVVGFGTFNTSTGVLNPNNATTSLSSLIIKGLPLANYAIKFTITTASTQVSYADAIDYITPIHINNSNLKTGSLSLKSESTTSPVNTNTVKWQRKILKANFNSVGSLMSDLCFNNLKIGKTYKGIYQIHHYNINNGTTAVSFKHDNKTVGYSESDPETAASTRRTISGAFTFTATSTFISAELTLRSDASCLIEGDGTELKTWLTIEELPDHEQTIDW